MTSAGAPDPGLPRERRRVLARLRRLRLVLPPVDSRWVANRRMIVTAVSYGLLALAFVLGVVWFISPGNSRWEPAVNSLTLVAGLTGIFVERLTAEAERRTEVLRAVADELRDKPPGCSATSGSRRTRRPRGRCTHGWSCPRSTWRWSRVRSGCIATPSWSACCTGGGTPCICSTGGSI
ncbi:hypothetical protein OG558_17390 [Kribbella sp. NBC_01510]|uniref:hypothetical protein n=1 Tax=Kribbella sp. NBC_01510 TaxID=2903581 RepID=UPI003870CE9E